MSSVLVPALALMSNYLIFEFLIDFTLEGIEEGNPELNPSEAELGAENSGGSIEI